MSHSSDARQLERTGDSSSATFRRILEDAKAGHQSALWRSMEGPLRSIKRQAVRIWPGRESDASDVVQESLLEAVRSIGQCQARNRARFIAWLSGILRNVVKERLRSEGRSRREKGREQPLVGDGLETAVDRFRDGGNDPVEEAIRREETEWVDRTLEWLRDEDREFVRLRFYERLTHREIAARMNLEHDAIRKRAERIGAPLRQGIAYLKWMHQHRWIPVQREAICLRHFHSMTPSSIAERLDIPEAAVKSWIDELRSALPADGEGTP
jgi:RNA polymerase sigma factor (sigma-70 family)